jgi:hypothetical protein
MDSAVAIDAYGNFVISWTGDPTGSWGLYAQHFSSCGTSQGAQLQVGTANSSSAVYSDVALDQWGNCVFTWSSSVNGNWTNYVQQFNVCGQAMTGQLQIGSTGSPYQTYTGIAMTLTGQLVVVSDGATCNGYNDVFAQIGLQG